jgi:hypothetical protein
MLHDRESHALGVASRLNPCAFHHEHYSAFGRPRAMLYAVRNCESLIRRKLDRFVFQVDEQLARHHEEKLVLLVVVMPVKFTLNDTKSNDTVVDRTKRLIEPFLLAIAASYARPSICRSASNLLTTVGATAYPPPKSKMISPASPCGAKSWKRCSPGPRKSRCCFIRTWRRNTAGRWQTLLMC